MEDSGRRKSHRQKGHKDKKEAKEPRDKDYDRDSAIYDTSSVYSRRDQEYRRYDRQGYDRYERSERADREPKVRSERSERRGYERQERYQDRPEAGYTNGNGEHRQAGNGDQRQVQIVTRRPAQPSPSPEKSGSSGAQSQAAGAAKKQPQFTVPSMGVPFTKCRLMDDEWAISVASASNELLEHGSEFTVIACVGLQGVGKSTVLSLLHSPLLAAQSQGVPPDDEQFKAPLGVHTASSCLEGLSAIGVDMCVSSMDRLLLLDAQPLFESIQSPQSDLKCELYLVIFLASICHTLLVVTDTEADPQLWKFMRLLAMLKSKVPNLATWSRSPQAGAEATVPAGQEVLPRLLVAFNNMDSTSEGMEEPLRNFLSHTLWEAAPSIDFIHIPHLPGASLRELLCSEAAATAGLRLRQRLLAGGPARGRFGREGLQLTERQWLHRINDYWEFIQKSPDIESYFDTVATGLEHFGWPKPKF